MQKQNLEHQLIFNNNHPQPINFKIIFNDPFFARNIKLIYLPNFPKSSLLDYSYEYHPKYIQFCYIGHTYNKQTLIQFAHQISSNLSQIKITTFNNPILYKNNKYPKILTTLNTTPYLFYKIIKKNINQHKQGDILFYYTSNNLEGIEKIINSIKQYIEDTIHIPISTFIQKFSIPQNLIESVFQSIINHYYQQFQSIASLKSLQINSIHLQKFNKNNQKSQSIIFSIQGPSSNFQPFLQQINYTLKTIPILILKFQQIRTFKLTQIPQNFTIQNKNTILDHNTLLILNRNITNKKFLQLQTGQHFLNPNIFTNHEKKVISKYFPSQKFQQQLQKQFTSCQNCQLYNQSVIIKCLHKDIQKIISIIQQYSNTFIQQTIPILENNHPLIQNIFYQHFIQQIPNATFKFVNQTLYRCNFTKETPKIVHQIAHLTQQITTKICQVPTLAAISKHLANANNFTGLYLVQKNPQNMFQKSLKSSKYRLAKKCSIILTDLSNLVIYEQQIIIFIHNQTPSNSIIYKICSQHKINLQQFIQGANKIDQKICRIKKFTNFISFSFKNIIILFCNISQVNYRQIKQDIYNCLIQSNKFKKINFIISKQSKKFYQDIVPIILNKASKMIENSEIKASEIFFYAEKLSELSHLERTILKSNIEIDLLTKDYFNEWSFLKMNNLKEFVLSYLWVNDTLTLPGIDSYLFWLQQDQSSSKKALVTLPGHEYTQKKYKQFVVSLKQKIVYEIDSLCTIKIHQMQKMSQDFKTLSSIVWKQKFLSINYFVIYGLNSDDIIAKDLCLNLYYKNQKVNKLIPLNFNLKERTVSINKKMNQVHYAITRKTHVDWYKFYLHQDSIQTFQNCLEK